MIDNYTRVFLCIWQLFVCRDGSLRPSQVMYGWDCEPGSIRASIACRRHVARDDIIVDVGSGGPTCGVAVTGSKQYRHFDSSRWDAARVPEGRGLQKERRSATPALGHWGDANDGRNNRPSSWSLLLFTVRYYFEAE